MPTDTLPANTPTAFKAFDQIPDAGAALAEHTRIAQQIEKPDAEPPEDFSLAGMKKMAEKSATKVEPPVKTEVKETPKEQKVEKAEKVESAPAKTEELKPITAETTDDELNQRLETDSKIRKYDKATKEHLRQTNWSEREAWRKAKAAQTEAETYKTEVAKFKDKTPDSDAAQAIQKKLEEAQKRLEEQENELAGSRVEKTTLFKTQIGEPLQAIESKFKKFASEYDIPPADIIELASLKGRAQDAKFEDLTADWPKTKSNKLFDLLEQHSELQDKRAEFLGRAKQTYESVQAQEREARDLEQARIASERAAVLPTIWEKAVESAIPSIKGVNGELGEEIKGVQGFIRQADDQWFLKQPVADRVRLAAQAAAFPVAVKHYEGRIAEMAAKLATAEKHVKELTVATPGAGGSPSAKQEASSESDAPAGGWNPFRR